MLTQRCLSLLEVFHSVLPHKIATRPRPSCTALAQPCPLTDLTTASHDIKSFF